VFAAAILTGAALAVTACGSAAIPTASDAAQNCRSSNEQLAAIATQTNQVRAAAEANPVVAANGFASLAAITADLPDCSEVESRRAREAYLRALRRRVGLCRATQPANPARLAAADAMLAQARAALADSAASQSAAAASRSAEATPGQP
jgi:hypothetical protein